MTPNRLVASTSRKARSTPTPSATRQSAEGMSMTETPLVVMSSQRASYQYRAYPDKKQKAAFQRIFECVRLVYSDHLFANGFGVFGPRLKYRNAYEMQAILVTKAKKTADRQQLTAAPDTALRQSVADAHDACQKFFDSVSAQGKHNIVEQPRYKDENEGRQTFRLARPDFALQQVSARRALLRLPKKLGMLSFNWSRDLPSDPSSVTIIKTPDGKYWVSFVSVRQTVLAPALSRWAGIDFGLTDLVSIVCSDGTREKVTAPRYGWQAEKQIAAATQQMRRAQQGSRNYGTARIKLARIQRKVADRRADHLHKLAFRLVNTNQTIAFETLDIAGMARGHFRSAIHDAGWGILLKLVLQKSERQGRVVKQVGRYEPTSQTCAPCGAIDGPKDLSIREWRCPQCGVLLDRDFNAAVNVLVAAGCPETLNAGGRALRILLARAVPKAGTASSDAD